VSPITGASEGSLVSEAGPAPAGLRLVSDPGTRLLPRGSGGSGAVLVGGSPVRVLRLTAAGARQVAGWLDGAPVPDAPAARALARRLLDAGLVHPEPAADLPGVPAPADVTVVVPVRDRHAELARCLDGLTGLPHVLVVDDASAEPAAIKAIAAARGADTISRPVNGGPAAARNSGLRSAKTDLVAFLDSDCVPEPGWLTRLLPHFADPAVGAVAPRIIPRGSGRGSARGSGSGHGSGAGAGWLARYEGASSSLDMGARPSVVRPGARVSYVPGAALVVRRSAAGAGFADGMQVGEDVDFVWRLAASGWRVRYEPAAVMAHDHRVTFRAWFSRRADYGTSAAALEERHPRAVRPLYASWWTAGAWAAALAGRPVTAAALTATATALLARRLAPVTGEGHAPAGVGRGTWELALRLAGGGTLAAGRPLGSALSRTWWPVAVPAAVAVRRLRLPVALLILTPPLLDWADRRPPLDPARYVAARLLDDVAYSLGVWQGCVARRTVRPLLPVLGGTFLGRRKLAD
jgi:mycofactocin glycosyltransferase